MSVDIHELKKDTNESPVCSVEAKGQKSQLLSSLYIIGKQCDVHRSLAISVESVYKNCERLNEACYTKLRRLIANHYTIMYTEPD